jgi:hypothetical protein
MSAEKTIVFCCMIAAALLVSVVAPAPARVFAQQTFENPDAAALAFVDAVAARDNEAISSILGDDWKEFIPTEDIDEEDIELFLAAWEKSHRIEPFGEKRVRLAVGTGGWTLPIPIVEDGGAWRFDTRAGAMEMRIRRIGRNELAAMEAVLAYFDAQKEFALVDRNGDGVLEYAQKLRSSPGKRDGLYWPAEQSEDISPLGPFFGDDEPGKDYHGYYYKILTGQGSNAPGGAYDYMIGGRMVAGFALVAWPVDYGDSGVTTFIVNHDGQVYENDLETETDKVARAMALFDPDPDSGWEMTTARDREDEGRPGEEQAEKTGRRESPPVSRATVSMR